MKRLTFTLAALAAIASMAFAASLPANGSVTVTNENGVMVGTGTIQNGHLTLTLQTGMTGFVSITVTGGPSGDQTFQAMVGAGGHVTVVNGDQLQNLASFAKASGVAAVEVTEKADVGGSGSASTDHASATGQTEKTDNAAAPEQELENSQAGDHSQGNGQVTGSKTPGKDDSTSASGSGSASENESTSSGDSVSVGTKVGGSVSVGTDTGSDGSGSSGD